jgi:hypothetical protein
MLRSDEILDFLKQHKQDLEARFSVRRIGLFGSVLRGSASDCFPIWDSVDVGQGRLLPNLTRRPRRYMKKLRELAMINDIDLWFEDECHFQQHGSRCAMWIPPEDIDPVVLQEPTRKSIGVFGAVRISVFPKFTTPKMLLYLWVLMKNHARTHTLQYPHYLGNTISRWISSGLTRTGRTMARKRIFSSGSS